MHYEGSFEAPVARDKLYSFVIDPKRIIAVIPDVTDSKIIDQDHFFVKAKAGIGPLKGDMEMNFTVAGKKRDTSAKLVGKGRGMQSSVDLSLLMTLEEAPGGCRGKWVADASLGGMLAGVGARLISVVVERYIRQITEDLSKNVTGL